MNPFACLASVTRSDLCISKEEYKIFCKEFVFEALRGKRFGQYFCEKFKINDDVLSNLSDSLSKYHIENLGYIKNDSSSNRKLYQV